MDDYYKPSFPNGYPDIICPNLFKVNNFNWYTDGNGVKYDVYDYKVGGVNFLVHQIYLNKFDGNYNFNPIDEGTYYVLWDDSVHDSKAYYDFNSGEFIKMEVPKY